jgi:hypothetical protein
MIKVSFDNGIRIETGDLKYSFSPDQLPLKVEIQRAVSKEIIWTTELNSNMWATYPESEINHVLVYDAKGKFVYQRFWEPVTDGSIFYQALALYCKSVSNKLNKVKGLVIELEIHEKETISSMIKYCTSLKRLCQGHM